MPVDLGRDATAPVDLGRDGNVACPDGCLIDTTCVDADAVNPANQCELCEIATSRTAWSPRTGASCDDGAYCTTGEICDATGACGGSTARDCADSVACNGAETCNEATDSCDAGTTTCVGATVCDVASGACVTTCTETLCGGTMCVDIGSDPLHCGACDTPCAARTGAVASCGGSPTPACSYACDTGRLDCNAGTDGCEVASVTDRLNCGACGRVCGEANAQAPCAASTCGTLACNVGFSDCNADLGTGGDGCETTGVCSRFRWHTTWGDDLATDQGSVDVAADAAGNVYVTASFGSELRVGTTLYTAGRNGGVIVALDPAGAIRWVRGIRSSDAGGDCSPQRVAIGSAGELYVAGYGFNGNCEIDGVSIGALGGQETSFLARLTTAGAVTWGRTYPIMTGYPTADMFGLAALASGGVVMTGQLGADSLTMDGIVLTKSTTGPGQREGWVAFVSGAGTVTSAFRFAPNSYIQPYGVAVLPGGDVVVVGNAAGASLTIFGAPQLISEGGDGFFARFTPAGVAVASQVLSGTTGNDGAFEVRVGASGDYYISGAYDGSIALGSATFSGASSGAYLARVGAATNALTWAIGQSAGNAQNGLRRFQIDASETIHAGWASSAGATSTFGGVAMPSTGGFNSYIAHVTSAGTVTRLEAFDATDTYYASAIALGNGGRNVVAGWFLNTLTIPADGETFTSAGNYDQFAAQLEF